MRVLHSSYSALRRVRALVIGIFATSLLLLPTVKTPVINAAGTVLATQNLSNSGDQSEAPQIAYGGGYLAAIWGERSGQSLGYDRTPAGSVWPKADFKGTGTNTQYQWSDIVVDSAGTFHMVYAAGNNIYHRSNTLAGQLSSAHTVASSNFPNPVRMAIAPNGTLWVVWRDGDGTGIFYKRSTDGGLNWSNGNDGGKVAGESGNMFAPDVAVGTDNIPHVVWYIRGSGTYKGEIRVADWNGSSFTASSITTDGADNSCCYDADPTITVDSSNVQHAVWRKQLDGNGGKWAITYARRPSGGSWQDFTPVAIVNGDAKYNPAIGTDTNGALYVTYSQPTNNTRPRKVYLVAKSAGGTWDTAQALSDGPWDYRGAVVGVSGTAHVTIQHEVGTDDGEIIYYRVQYTAPAPPVSATPVINSGAPSAKDAQVTVTFKDVTGSPNKVRYHWGAAPTDADTWITPFPSSIGINRPSDLTQSDCASRTLYVQAAKDSTLGPVKTAAIIFDIGVQAAVTVVNPHMSGLPTFFNNKVQDAYNAASPGESTVSDGDPDYTRERFAFLGINGYNDCSGLSTFSIVGSSSGAITNNIFNGTVALPQGSAVGPHAFDVTVLDKLGNSQEYSKTLIYDPANTDTTGTNTNTLGLPTLAAGGSVTADSGNGVVRTLTFQNISVNDTTYGTGKGLPPGKQFWGVWIANATSDVGADSTSLVWYPVPVSAPNSTFSVRWSLFSGLGFTSDLTSKTGDYFVYVRFLDGAGNPSTRALPVLKVTLTAGYTLSTSPLPLIRK